MSTYSIEHVRRVYDDAEGVYVEVGPDDDGLGLVQIGTAGKSAEYYGAIRLVLTPAQARLIAEALIGAADDAGAKVTP